MAFLSRVGSLLKQSVSKHVPSSNVALFQTVRSMSTSSKVFVGGLSYSTDENSLREAFGQYGDVVDARVVMDRDTGRSRGFAFVTYGSPESASSAIQALDGQDLHGRNIRVNYATERPPRTGGFDGGFNYGGQGGNYGRGGNGGFDGYGGGGGYQGYQNRGGGYGNSPYPSGGGGGFGGQDNYPSGGGGFANSQYSSGGGGGFGGQGNYPSGGGGGFDSGNNFPSGAGNYAGQTGFNQEGNTNDFAGDGYGNREANN